MKRILVLGKYYPPFSGGIEENTRDVAELLARDDDVTVFCFNHRPGHVEEQANGVHLVRFRTLMTLRSQPINFRMIWRAFRFRCDVIHLHAPNFIAVFAIFLRGLARVETPIIITHHTDVYGRRFLRSLGIYFYKTICQKAEFVIVTSAKNLAFSRDLPKKLNAVVIPLGIDAPEAPVINHPVPQVMQGSFVIGFLGRLARYKGVGVLLRAVAHIPYARVIVAGDGPYRRQAEELARSLGLTDRVTFLGDVRDEAKLQFFQSIDAFAFPSTEVTETFGITQLEAMAMGIPVLASDLPTGVTDVSIHEKTALLVTPGDPESLAAGIERMHDDRTLRERLVANAFRHVTTGFSKQSVLKRTVALFQGIPQEQS